MINDAGWGARVQGSGNPRGLTTMILVILIPPEPRTLNPETWMLNLET
jgi:hypothetical protein